MSTGSPRFGERAEFGENDVCYRHPNRQSFTLCQRCGRTICAECQVVSPVGLLCRDCVKQTSAGGGRATTRIARGARVRARKFAALESPVTYTLIALNVLVFGLQLLSHYFGADGVTRALWYSPLYSLDIAFEPWRMVTVMFTHSVSFLPHILFNMLTLYLFGRNLETIIGRWRFLFLYLLAGVGGSLAVMLWSYAQPETLNSALVGASGAIFGVLGATVVAFRAMKVNATSLIVLLVINFAIGFMPGTSVSWQAHLGGMLVGALVMWVITSTRGPRKKTAQIVGLSACTLGVALLSCAYLFVLPI